MDKNTTIVRCKDGAYRKAYTYMGDAIPPKPNHDRVYVNRGEQQLLGYIPIDSLNLVKGAVHGEFVPC